MGACCASCSPEPHTLTTRYRRALILVVVLNGLMFLVESSSSLFAGSAALQADALDFLADTLTYSLTLSVLHRPLSVRSRAALLKGASLGLMAILVLGAAIWRFLTGTAPEYFTMETVAVLALAANLASVLLLYRFRDGDANMTSVWQCSRNDAIGNLAVFAAAIGVSISGSAWPDLAVAVSMAGLFLGSCLKITRQALEELKTERKRPSRFERRHTGGESKMRFLEESPR